MNLNDHLHVEPYTQEGIDAQMWKATFDYNGLKIVGIGADRASLLYDLSRKTSEMSVELGVITEWIRKEVKYATP